MAGLFNNDIGRCFNTGAASGQEKLRLLAVVVFGERLHGLHHAAEGVGLVVGEVGVER